MTVAQNIACVPKILKWDSGRIDARVDELLRIHAESGGTFVFVTHDVAEACRLATKILVMDAGRVQQYGTPEELRAAPATPFVAELFGSGSDARRDEASAPEQTGGRP